MRRSRLGVFARVFSALAAEAGVPDRLMIDGGTTRAGAIDARQGCLPVLNTT